ncbi:hypothetical protein GIB67_008056 [Kingdonia uniflora]|uniref:Uncharacterized protein n=1 Tax=Kingdonia uniflora TaxID=39325 RepID=A0A7J7MN27_9MAGN|nr:hypothetical protein GIB67_008056 [Kingdonia uniflora]
MNQMFLCCLLHGFPSHFTTSSGALVSCVLMVVDVIEGLMKDPAKVGVFKFYLAFTANLRVYNMTTIILFQKLTVLEYDVLSVMAYDYPTEKLSVYLSDDGRAPKVYFARKSEPHNDCQWLAMKILIEGQNGNAVDSDVEAKPLKEVIQVLDGTTLIGKLDDNTSSLSEISDKKDGKLSPAGLHHWKELAGSGFFVCSSSLKSNVVFVASVGFQDVFAKNMRHTAVPLVGITAYEPLSKDKSYYLGLHDDGISLFPKVFSIWFVPFAYAFIANTV